MTTHRTLILGAGAAGTAAARALAEHHDLDVTLVGRGSEEPYSRMLIKGVAVGSSAPGVTRLPLPSVRFVSDTAVSIDADVRMLGLRSGLTETYDSLIIATGSAPRQLASSVAGAAEARTTGTLTTLHSLRDALHIRRILERGPRNVLLYGGGIIAAETASLLADAGHGVTLIARSSFPGESVFGARLARSIAELHRDRVDTLFGATLAAVSHDERTVTAHLDDGSSLTGDLLIVALGTVPLSPAPWNGGILVDDRQRTTVDGVWAAGGATVHDDARGMWRIDHWEDSTAQGTHAAQHLLHVLDRGHDPGPYLPRSAFLAMIHGHVVSGVGLTAPGTTRIEPGEEFVQVHEHADGTPVGASGLDAVLSVHRWRERLHGVSTV
ncbi:FAD-dependent oxidoreductase [Microbacterium sp. MYb62]|uniref:FAD-dependent oxidoreductase n=1 Tax=Microbacterium sp. MYb62 TaxID=1848690 RepID=UPI000CFC62F6|nr:NAD(P)/FAD-dependent oxidoreductase [Microbacterium sp. MYb62]PRB14149.1 ferredoxin reductase [Microbacterium sp. MYb62]